MKSENNQEDMKFRETITKESKDALNVAEKFTQTEEKINSLVFDSPSFDRLGPPNENSHGYVADHWAQAIRIKDIEGNILFECEMMVIFKEDFPLAEKLKTKLVEKISSIQEEVYKESFLSGNLS